MADLTSHDVVSSATENALASSPFRPLRSAREPALTHLPVKERPLRPPYLTPRNVLLTAVVGTTLAMAGLYARARALDDGWQVGELRADGLRIVPTGRADASAVLPPRQFTDSATRHAYWVATQIPEVLNQLYCWCGCENTGQHRSSLACFEDMMGTDCEICQGTAEIAYTMVRHGTTNAAKIQSAVDARWGPRG